MSSPRPSRRRQLLCTEPLERRWLLSVAPALPPPLAAAIQHAYPGASVLSVEVSTDDGRQEYDVTATVTGGMLDATLSPDGKIVESELLPARRSEPPAAATDDTLPVEAPAAAAADGGVGAVSLTPAELVDQDQPLSPNGLPPAVVSALQSLYPGARVIEAEADAEDGQEIGLQARVNGVAIDVSFMPDGKLIESQVALPPSELPAVAADWVRRHFPGGSIDDAQAVTRDGRVTYEFTITPRDGPPVEASLDLGTTQVAFVGSTTEGAAGPTVERNALIASTPPTDQPSTAEPGTTNPRRQADASPDPSASGESDRVYAGAEGSTSEPRPPDPSASVDQESERLELVPGDMLPARRPPRPHSRAELAAGFAAALPVELARAARRLHEVLRGLDALAATRRLADALSPSLAARAVGAAALLAAAHLLLADWRKPRSQPFVIFRDDIPRRRRPLAGRRGPR